MDFGKLNILQISFFIALAYFFTSPSAFSQSPITIEGHILNQENKPLDVANILLMSLNSNSVIASSISDENGSFSLSPQKILSSDSLRIHIMRTGIKSQSFVIPNRSHDNLTLQVVEESFNLDELVVKAEKVKESGDTIQYMMSSFQSITDKSLADVLRKMPGISVEKDGKIRYQGEEITTLYIEGLNMLRGQYGIATNNIHPDDVASVEVLQNHQEIEALKEISEGEKAAINIRLKESSKGVWTSRTTLAAGIEKPHKGLWDGKLMTSRFARSNQELTLIKTNNTGMDISSELYSYGDYLPSLPLPIANINVAQASMLDDKYYRDNKDLTTSLNTLFKVGKKATAGLNITYANIEDSPVLHEISTHLLPNG